MWSVQKHMQRKLQKKCKNNKTVKLKSAKYATATKLIVIVSRFIY